MAKRAEKGQRALKGERSARWTVRGVEPRLQRAAGDAARARGLTLGHWLNAVLADVTAGTPPAPILDATTEARLARLERAVFGADAFTTPP